MKLLREKREKSGNTGAKFAITVRCNVEKCSGNYSLDNNESELHKYEEKEVLMLCFG